MLNEKNKDSFCIIPWIHAHTWPDGRVFPCCTSDSRISFGNINEESLSKIHKNEKFNQLRSDMLDGVKREDICHKCYSIESYKTSKSMREKFNTWIFGDKLFDLIDQDNPTSPNNLLYWDFRFSNLCNLSCRTCGDDLSSSWTKDKQSLYPEYASKKFKIFTPSELEYTKMIDEQLDHVEIIYFAGGEPLLMKEHSEIIQKLIAKRKTNVRLEYNTNLSTVQYKDKNFIDLWKNFDYVLIGASLDEIEDRAEYWRNGSNWKAILKNLEKLVKASEERLLLRKKLILNYAVTVSIFNAHRLGDIFEYFFLTKKLYTKNTQLNFNILETPDYYDMKLASPELKLVGLKNLEKLVKVLEKVENLDFKQMALENAKKLKEVYLQDVEDKDRKLFEFASFTAKLDKIRNQNIKIVAPEIYETMLKNSSYQQIYDDFKFNS